MSKSKGNVVPPSSVIEPYGADTMRLAILFVAPPEKDFDWDEKAVAGANRFIKRAWRVVWELTKTADASAALDPKTLDVPSAALNRELHALGLRCTHEFDEGQFNTAISAVMELINAVSSYLNDVAESERSRALCYRVASDIVAMLAPIIPHWAEELQHAALHKETPVYHEPWPIFDEAQAKSNTIEIAVQIKGKVRARIMVDADASEDELSHAAQQAVAQQLEGREIRKVIVVPGRLVNIVV